MQSLTTSWMFPARKSAIAWSHPVFRDARRRTFETIDLRGSCGGHGADRPSHPRVVAFISDNTKALEGDYLEGADLVVEVVSPDDPDRDWVKKREEYARAGIPEYWIVDPSRESITVLRLESHAYVIECEHSKGAEAYSVLLPGFKVPVGSALAGS